MTKILIFNAVEFKKPAISKAIKETHRNEPRNTFGIIDPLTAKKYPDLLSSHLELRRITFNDWFVYQTITESADRQKPYKLLLDHKTAKTLIQQKEIKVLISFQHRTSGCYAVARTFDPNKTLRKEAI
jgi:hypothetical protein